MIGIRATVAAGLLLALLLGGCASTNRATAVPSERDGAPGAGERLRVVATTTIVADVVRNVGGDRIALTTLLPTGADPHSFEPTPQDVATLNAARIIFANGAGLEAFLDRLLQNVDEDALVVSLSDGLELLEPSAPHVPHHDYDEDDVAQVEEPGHDGEEDEHGHIAYDPHVWFDPHHVMVWADTIAEALGALGPEGAGTYRANAAAYKSRLERLDQWIEEQVTQVPPENRRLVTDHAAFTYFAACYGFEQVGALLPGTSTLAESSAQELARLEEAIREYDVKAIFVGLTVNPSLAERVAQDTGVQLVFLYTGSLSGPEGPASDYISMMEYNVTAIVAALR